MTWTFLEILVVASLALKTILPILAVDGRLPTRARVVHRWWTGGRIIGKGRGRDRSRKVGEFGWIYGRFWERKGVKGLVGKRCVCPELLRKHSKKVVVCEIGEMGGI